MESGTLAPYRDALEHLSDELEWLRCRIQAAVASGSVSAGAAETNLAGPPIGGDQGVAAAVTSRQLGALLPDHQRDWIDERIGKTRRSGLQLPLAQLGEAFGLSRLEREILLLLLAWALELDLRALLRWFGGDPAQRRLDVGLLAALLTSGLAGRDEVMACVSAGRPLRERRLIGWFWS